MNDKVYRVVMTGIITSLVLVATLIIRIPVPFTQGYVHPGDAVIFLGVLILGKKHGTFAAGVGSALADFIGGYAYYAPWTLVVKSIMAFAVGAALEYLDRKSQKDGTSSNSPSWLTGKGRLPLIELLAMFIGGVTMTVGYYIAASLMQGNWYTPLFSVPGNIGQFIIGMILAIALATALYKTPARKFFVIK